MKFSITKPFPICLLLCLPLITNAHTDISDERELGTVNFPVSCNEKAQKLAVRGLALMHHMTYEDARSSFIQASDADQSCAMAYWGAAMTYIHPLWSDPPNADEYTTM